MRVLKSKGVKEANGNLDAENRTVSLTVLCW